MLDVGVIGIGPHWESRYRPALEALRHRLRVRAVASPVTAMAEHVAAEFRAETAPSLTSLAERRDLRALLVLEPSWHGDVPVHLALQSGKAVFLGVAAEPELAACADDLAEAGLIVPELPLRYTPATQRLRELLATKLGRVRRVELELADSQDADAERSALVDALDWCRSLVGDCIARVVSTEPSVGVQLALSRAGGEAVPVELRWSRTVAVVCQVHCEKGTVAVRGHRQLSWECEQSRNEETLEADRDELQLMLDHFSRRVVGGLISVPTLEDIGSARRLAELIAQR
jgi:predicted dehydrogenase